MAPAPASLLLRLLTQKMEVQPNPVDEQDIQQQKPLVKTLAIAL